MNKEIVKRKAMIVIALIVAIGLIGMVGHKLMVGKKTTQLGSNQPVDVKAIQVMQQDTALQYDFTGKVAAKSEVKIMSKVAGSIVEKMVKGGDMVYKGQPLFRVDNKQYRSAIRSSQGTLNQSRAQLRNAQVDLERYEKLSQADAISQQTVDTQRAAVQQYAADVEANEAKVQEAQEDEQDTLILSPVSGRIDVNDLNIGDFVAAGSTVLATVSTVDPVWVQFSMSENEYLQFAMAGNGSLPDNFKNNVQLTLSNGAKYPLIGHVEQIDRGMSDTTGTITIKAAFENPQHLLLPGMFAKVSAPGVMQNGAMLIPQRAVKELLGKTLVTVVTEDQKAESRAVDLGEKVGNLWIVKQGLNPGEIVVAEGIDKIKAGTSLNVNMVTLNDLQNQSGQ